MSTKKIYLKDIITSSVSHLIEEYREISKSAGWHQFLGNNKIGNIANAQALLMFQDSGIKFEKSKKVLNTLINNQFIDKDISLNGGWSFQTNYNEAPTTECTSWVLLALNTELDPSSEITQRGINWLLKNQPECKEDTGWGSIKNDTARIYSTCLALQALCKYNKMSSEHFQSALTWLKHSQNNDGGWGATNTTVSNLTHTSHSIITLISCGYPPESIIIQKAANFILDQLKNTDIFSNNEHIGWRELLEIEEKRITIYHYSIAWVIKALQLSHKTSTSKYKALFKELITEEQNGNWVHPYLKDQNKHTIWSKHDSLSAITYHNKKISNSISLKKTNLQQTLFNSIKFKELSENWFVVSIIAGLFVLLLLQVAMYYPLQVIIFFVAFLFIYLKNPKARFFRLGQSIFALLTALLVLPSYKVEFEEQLKGASGFNHLLFKLFTIEVPIAIYVILAFLIGLCLLLDFKTREPNDK